MTQEHAHCMFAPTHMQLCSATKKLYDKGKVEWLGVEWVGINSDILSFYYYSLKNSFIDYFLEREREEGKIDVKAQHHIN